MPPRKDTQPQGPGGRFVKKGAAVAAVAVAEPPAVRRQRPNGRSPLRRTPRLAPPTQPRGSWDPPAPEPPELVEIPGVAAAPIYDHVDAPADPAALALLAKLREQTQPMNRYAARPPQFNAPDLWYARRDGDIVLLPGDAQAQAYYRSKGFHILTADERKEWLDRVRPLVVAEQRKRAAIITTLRRIAARSPGVEVAGDLELTPTDELQDMLAQLQKSFGGAVQVVQGRFREQEQDPIDASGVEIASGEDLERKLAASAAQRGGVRAGNFQGAGSAV